jgi:8-oxo-dGTP pyrophosphatase MutT (NUDIX family)
MYPTDLTVAAVVELDGRYLLVEETATGKRVFSQPSGHIEAGESPEQAVVRETLEETGCTVECGELIGVYLWIHPQTRQQFLRITYAASFKDVDDNATLDDGIISVRWAKLSEMESRESLMRTPAILRSVRDFEAGKRQSDELFTGMLPLQQNVHQVLAKADLI